MDVTILLVEDDVAIRNFYQLYLEHHGYRVCPAAGVAEAFRIANTQLVNLAVVDICLGHENGLDLVRSMKSSRLGIPVIVMSAMSYEEPGFQQALEVGADGVYTKQLPMSQLLMDIKRLLSNRDHDNDSNDAGSSENTLLRSPDLRMRSGN